MELHAGPWCVSKTAAAEKEANAVVCVAPTLLSIPAGRQQATVDDDEWAMLRSCW